MSPAQQRLLALWALLLSAVVCLVFLPVSRMVAVAILLAVWGGIAVVWSVTRRRADDETGFCFDNLPAATYRQPVVLVCGDLPQSWPGSSPVLTVSQGCWIRLEDHQNVTQVARQLLWQRPEWGRQLSVLVSVCPQKQTDTDSLTSRLLALRWQISRLRRETGHTVPLVLSGQVGSAMMNDMLWQMAIPGEGISVWRDAAAPEPVAARSSAGGAMAMQPQVLMNSLTDWFHQHAGAVFTDARPDIPVVTPAVVLWGLGPVLAGSLSSSAWTAWLQRHTALRHAAGWHPVGTDSTVLSLLPEVVLPLLPAGRGLTPRQRLWRNGVTLFILAAVAALLSSAWHNRQLLHRVSVDIQQYEHIPMNDYGPKAEAVNVLRQDMAQLDGWARNGEPLRMSLGLYQGGRLRQPLLNAIRTYVPQPPPPPKPEPKAVPVPKTVRLDSLSLFDSGKSELKAGSTKMLVNSLVDIKARPGWLIVISGHTDNTGSPQQNQALSLKRAAAVRDWMRDTGDVPESCFAVQGYGASRPVATNDTPAGRALNRRVEISLVPQADACQIPDTKTASPDESDAPTQEMEM
ncbi:OmpA family protein [Erwinia endophytica]|uniref:OmpA family protein n=1 Tax=Erwinia endophytica TaxID=1563158 RepID=UPI001265F3D4|nr:OmpA family protein [Erwinia endophytica]KAB8309937.1 OmpA family protein [Erwinia endophytica]